jgi:L-aminopeptidase/D-esterase-like protein
MNIVGIVVISSYLTPSNTHAEEIKIGPSCDLFVKKPDLSFLRKTLTVPMNGLLIGSATDPTEATGATVFYFPRSANVSYDSRGGSVASSETTLLDEGSYSNSVDAIVFAGGSTMGLAAGDGVRQVLFKNRAQNAGNFDFIPSVPTAVVYDYCGRICSHHDPLVFPDAVLGAQLMSQLKREFVIGKAGAGISTSMNKINLNGAPTVWGGQGAAYHEYPWGRIFVAVVVNALGDVRYQGQSLSQEVKNIYSQIQTGPKKGQNTTLSLVVTDLNLSRSQLKRLSVMVHTSMGESIFPFHSLEDGDINFSASLGTRTRRVTDDIELKLQVEASRLMKQAILDAVATANGVPKTILLK